MEHFKIEVKYKDLDKDGGSYYFDFVNIWSSTQEKALEMTKKLWHTKFNQTDLVLIDTILRQ